MYVQTVSGKGASAVRGEEGEDALDGGVGSAGWNIEDVVSVCQRFSC